MANTLERLNKINNWLEKYKKIAKIACLISTLALVIQLVIIYYTWKLN